MKGHYFAWVRERIGKAEEEIVPPDNIKTVAELINAAKTRPNPMLYGTPGVGSGPPASKTRRRAPAAPARPSTGRP